MILVLCTLVVQRFPCLKRDLITDADKYRIQAAGVFVVPIPDDPMGLRCRWARP